MDFLIVEPFNASFFAVMALFVLLCMLFIKVFRNKSEEERKKAVIFLYIIVFIIFMLYKFLLSHDAEYSQIRIDNGLKAFNWFGELPLNLCNLNIIFVVIGLLLDSRAILGFSFFTSLIGAFAALAMPVVGFSGFSILLPRMLGYYVTHLAVMVMMPILAGLKLYRPKYSDILPIMISVLVTTLLMTGINFLFIKTGLNVECDYFYTVRPNGISILELLYKYIPVPWVYELPLMLIFVPYMLGLTCFFNILEKKKTR